ncbi:dethiobiotin synthase, partial [Legionella shakespearei]
MKRFFITGTDTDCGKTYVTRKLLQHFSRAAAIKPVASGCSVVNGELINSDAQHLIQYSAMSMGQINPWRFSMPVSPHIAAFHENKRLSANEIADYCLNVQVDNADTLFIEGAGGLCVPLNEEETWMDFLKYSDIPVILVVGMKLGCLNHALLTESALAAHNIPCVGWIANCIDPDMLALAENLETLKNKLKIPLLATIPFAGELSTK